MILDWREWASQKTGIINFVYLTHMSHHEATDRNVSIAVSKLCSDERHTLWILKSVAGDSESGHLWPRSG